MAIQSRATISAAITSTITNGGLLLASEDRTLRTNLIDSVVSRLGDTMTGDYAITGAISASETLTIGSNKNIILGVKNFAKFNSSSNRFQVGDVDGYAIPLFLSGTSGATSITLGANIAATGDLILTGKLYQSSKLITLNDGGAAASGSAVGIEVEENSSITGFLKTNAARTGWDMLAPAQAYKATFLLSSFTADRIFTLPDSAGVIATQAYADALVVGLWDDRGNYDASSNLFPATGGSGTAGALLKGDIFMISVAGTLGGVPVATRQTVRVLVDTPGQTASNWAIGLANTDIDDSITDGVTGRAPSQNAVFDALALKEPVITTLNVARGGTNISSYAVGDLIYASGATTLSKLADIATGNALISGGVTTAPSWGKIGLTTHISGTLGVTNGGTGTATQFTQGSIIYAGASGVYAEDNANFFWDATNHRLGLGHTSPSTTIDARGTGEGLWLSRANGPNDNAPNIRIRKARGTYPSSITTVADQDYLGNISFEGYDGSSYNDNSVGIMGYVNGAVSSGVVPTDIIIANGTHTTSLLSNEMVRFNSKKNVGFWGSDFQDGVKVFYINNCTTVPTASPALGGFLYVQGGALKWRGSAGTVTQIAAA